MPHADAPVFAAGTPIGDARAVMILLHGRGATAGNILSLAPSLAVDGLAFLAPQADDGAWYPNRFIAPIAANEPWLTGALSMLDRVVESVRAAGVADDHIVLGGFSQGACLASEYAARHARRWGGVAVFSGGLIGPPGHPFSYDGRFDGMPAFFGCSDVDAHIPEPRVQESAGIYTAMGARVTVQIYPDMPHTIVDDELAIVKAMLEDVAGP
ncbi:MAG: alpha/beta hydrolase [Gemmatimonadaceae bacterium]